MTGRHDLQRRVVGGTAALAVLLAGACGLIWGRADALGALVGSLVTVANFALLAEVANRALSGRAGSGWRGRPLLWMGASTARLGLVALAIGIAALWGGVGVRGLLVSLLIVPVTVVVAGVATARAA